MLRPYVVSHTFCHVTQTAVIDALRLIVNQRGSFWRMVQTKKTRPDANFSQAHGMRVSLKCLPTQ
jgi:hypothetical protein